MIDEAKPFAFALMPFHSDFDLEPRSVKAEEQPDLFDD